MLCVFGNPFQVRPIGGFYPDMETLLGFAIQLFNQVAERVLDKLTCFAFLKQMSKRGKLGVLFRQSNDQGFTEISEGLKDAAKHAKGEKSSVVEHAPEALNVKAIRKKPA
jgi:hypothetical protein